jgi:Ser/Thr protein kinase RdoA (MazF antagonist)
VIAVTHSIISADAVLAEVAWAYALGAPLACDLLQAGPNDTYLVATRDGRYIARVYGARWRSPSDIAYELDLLVHLAGKGVPVAAPVPGKDGSLTHALAAPEGCRQLVVFAYAEGVPLSWGDDAHCRLAGRLAAMVHGAADGFASPHARRPLDLGYLIDAPLAALRPFLAHRPDDWRYLEALATRLRARAAAAAAAGLDWGICHGNYSLKNVRVAADQTPTVFGFNRCGPGWRAYDFALIEWGLASAKQRGIWDAFLRGYAAVRPLGAADLAAVPLFHAIHHLWRLGVQAHNVADWGASRLSDSNLNRELAFLRAWDAEHPGDG